MAKSSLALFCCINLLLIDQGWAQSTSTTHTIYGLDQGSNFKAPKHSTKSYMLQVASFEKYSNAINFKKLIASQIEQPVRIVPVKSIPIKYRAIIGPIADANTLITISNQLLSMKANPRKVNLVKIKPLANKKIALARKNGSQQKTLSGKPIRYNKIALQTKKNTQQRKRSGTVVWRKEFVQLTRKKTEQWKFSGKAILGKSQKVKTAAISQQKRRPKQNLHEMNSSKWQAELMPGFFKALDDEAFAEAPLAIIANNINATLKSEEHASLPSFLPNLKISAISIPKSERREEEQNWQKNLYLALEEERQRTTEGETPGALLINTANTRSSNNSREDQLDPKKNRTLGHNAYNFIAPTKQRPLKYVLKAHKIDKRTSLAYLGEGSIIPGVPTFVDYKVNNEPNKIKEMPNPNPPGMHAQENLPKLPEQKGAPVLTEAMLNLIKTMPYNDELYTLAYQSFIYNSHTEDAYHIALIAIKNRPDDIMWHRRLAQSATWAGDYNTGLTEWLYVAKRTKNPKDIEFLINTSKVLGYYGVLIEGLTLDLANNPNNDAEKLELAKAQNREGQPQQALSTLDKINSDNSTKEAFAYKATIYNDIGQWDKVLQTLQKMDSKFGITMQSIMTQANIYYSRGQIQEAINVLKKGIPLAKPNDDSFWLTLGDLAWLTNDRELIKLSFTKPSLFESKLMNLILLETPLNPSKALEYSLHGWYKKHTLEYLSLILYLGQQTSRWQLINDILLNLSGKELKKVSKTDLFWESQANLYQLLDQEELEKKVLTQSLLLHPKLHRLLADLLWLVISNGEERYIQTLMQRIVDTNLIDHPLIWNVFAQGFDTLNLFNSSLIAFRRHILQKNLDPQIYIDYAALLHRAELWQQAYEIRLSVWQKELTKLTRISSMSNSFSKRTLQALAQVAPFFVSGTDQVGIFNTLMGKDFNIDDKNIILNWIVPREYFPLMVYFKTYYYHNRLPDWAAIPLALIQNDRQTLQDILAKTDRQFPRSDRINAAVRLENLPLAMDFAYRELEHRNIQPKANEIYPEFTLYGLKISNNFSVWEEYEQFINIAGPKTKMESQFRLTNSLRLLPTLSYWSTRSTERNQITNVPRDFQGHLKLEQTIHRGSILYSLGYREALNSFVPASLVINYQLNSRWTADAKIGYNQEDFESSYLLIGGVHDEIDLTLQRTITEHDLLTVEAEGLKYYAQDRTYLASGYNLFGSLQHKFQLNYPDFTVGIFGHFHHFDRNGRLSGSISNLFPDLSPNGLRFIDPEDIPGIISNDYSLVVPPSYQEGGAYFSVGDTIQDYTHAWRPYFYGSIFYNTITRLSNNIRGGINGSVFGRDSLLIYGERGSAPAVRNGLNYSFGVRYKIFF